MRLLKSGSRGELNLTKDFVNNAPRYAILSRTWGMDEDEVSFSDLENGSGTSKAGYAKLQFCSKQAKKDALDYFWVDICCIDKSSSTEVSEAISSMFRWYKYAAQCFVYLSDVSKSGHTTNVQPSLAPWEAAFRKSRWFCRGWTLQELIAPASVKFFSREGDRLGSKRSLEQHIHDITGISIRALRGKSLKSFEVEERLSWAEYRETKRREDKANSLLGIFVIQMPLLYGEGKEKALIRLYKEIETSDHQLPERGSGPKNIKNLTPLSQVRAWEPQYYFFYGSHTDPRYIARSFELAEQPIVYRASLRGYSVARLGRWKALLNGPADNEVEGVAYKIEKEWHESKLILEESKEYVPGSCIITILTGDGERNVEGWTFKYYGPETWLKDVLPGASAFKDAVAAGVRSITL